MPTRRVADYMSTKIVSLAPESTVRDAERVLAEHGIGGAPVLDERGCVLGVVSQRDLVRIEATPATAGETGTFYTDMEELRDLAEVPVERHGTPVETIMNRSVLEISPQADVAEAARTMREHRVHRLLVTEDGVLVGILSALDLLRALADS